MAKRIDSPLFARPLPRQVPERLVGLAFRHSFACLQTGELVHKELLWQELANDVGTRHASSLARNVDGFVRCLRRSAARPIEALPAKCPGFCRDECLVISMVAASQHGSCPALKACAFALLQSVLLDEPMDAAAVLADRLAMAGQVLSLDAICEVAALVAPPPHRAN